MKKRFLLLVSLFAFAIFTSKVNASKCDSEQLVKINQDAAGVKVSYDVESEEVTDPNVVGYSDTGATYPVLRSRFKVKIVNVTDNLYIKVTNAVDGSVKTFTSKDAVDGVISFTWNKLNKVTDLKVEVYTSQATECPNENISTNHVLLPMYNNYSSYKVCENHPDEKICQEYVTEEVTDTDYKRLADKYEKEDAKEAEKEIKEKNKKTFTKFIEKNKKGIIIGGSIIVVLGVVTTAVVIIKRKRSRII